jgi:hypothetical protein
MMRKMQFRSKLLQCRAAAAGATLNKIYDVYMTPDGHFAAGEQEDAAADAKPRNGLDCKPSTSFAHKFDYLPNK